MLKHEPTEAEAAFLADLTELCRKHRLVIGGCGCCGSPSLDGLEDKEVDGHYEMNLWNGMIEWIAEEFQ